MRALANGTAETAADPAATDATRAVLDAVKGALAELDTYPADDLTDDVDAAERLGRLRALTGVLVAVADQQATRA